MAAAEDAQEEAEAAKRVVLHMAKLLQTGVPRHIVEAAAEQEGVDMQAVDDACASVSGEAEGAGKGAAIRQAESAN